MNADDLELDESSQARIEQDRGRGPQCRGHPGLGRPRAGRGARDGSICTSGPGRRRSSARTGSGRSQVERTMIDADGQVVGTGQTARDRGAAGGPLGRLPRPAAARRAVRRVDRTGAARRGPGDPRRQLLRRRVRHRLDQAGADRGDRHQQVRRGGDRHRRCWPMCDDGAVGRTGGSAIWIGCWPRRGIHAAGHAAPGTGSMRPRSSSGTVTAGCGPPWRTGRNCWPPPRTDHLGSCSTGRNWSGGRGEQSDITGRARARARSRPAQPAVLRRGADRRRGRRRQDLVGRQRSPTSCPTPPVAWLMATAASRATPLGALSRLAAARPGHDPSRAGRSACQHPAARAEHRAAIQRLRLARSRPGARGRRRPAAGCRSRRPCCCPWSPPSRCACSAPCAPASNPSDAVTALWKEQLVERLDLEPLDRAAPRASCWRPCSAGRSPRARRDAVAEQPRQSLLPDRAGPVRRRARAAGVQGRGVVVDRRHGDAAPARRAAAAPDRRPDRGGPGGGGRARPGRAAAVRDPQRGGERGRDHGAGPRPDRHQRRAGRRAAAPVLPPAAARGGRAPAQPGPPPRPGPAAAGRARPSTSTSSAGPPGRTPEAARPTSSCCWPPPTPCCSTTPAAALRLATRAQQAEQASRRAGDGVLGPVRAGPARPGPGHAGGRPPAGADRG